MKKTTTEVLLEILKAWEIPYQIRQAILEYHSVPIIWRYWKKFLNQYPPPILRWDPTKHMPELHERIAIFGPPGCGRSTLAHDLFRLMKIHRTPTFKAGIISATLSDEINNDEQSIHLSGKSQVSLDRIYRADDALQHYGSSLFPASSAVRRIRRSMQVADHFDEISTEVWLLEDLSPTIIKTGEFQRLWEDDRNFGVGVIYSYPEMEMEHVSLLNSTDLVFVHRDDLSIYPDAIDHWKKSNNHRFKHSHQFLVIKQRHGLAADTRIFWYQAKN